MKYWNWSEVTLWIGMLFTTDMHLPVLSEAYSFIFLVQFPLAGLDCKLPCMLSIATACFDELHLKGTF